MAGPGSYGKKEIDDGNEVVLLNDDVLTSVPNATLVIVDGNDLERISVLYQFPQFLEHCPSESINLMVPTICHHALLWTPDAQMAAAEALYFVVNVTVSHHVANQVACAALHIASDPDNIPLFDACGEIVSLILPQLHRYDVLHNIVPEAIDRAVSHDSNQRRLAARIIGSLNHALHPSELEPIFVNTLLNLSADPDHNVRALIAQSIAPVATKLPLRVAESVLWPRLRHLTADPNTTVKAAALRAMARSAYAHRHSSLQSDTFDSLIKPVFLQESQRACDVAASDLRVVDDDTYLILEIFAEVYGYFLCALQDLLDQQNLWKPALAALRVLVTCNGPTVRHWCAFNMPAISTLCSHAQRADHVTGILPSLAGDSDQETRATLAAGIHEVSKNLRFSSLRPDLVRAVGMLYMDDSAQVRMNALGHFSEVLSLLAMRRPPDDDTPPPNPQKGIIRVNDRFNIHLGRNILANDGSDEQEMRRLMPLFTSLEQMSFDSWRTQKLLAEEVQRSAHMIPQEMLCEHVAPLLFRMARESTFLVRKAAMHALIHVLRYVSDVRRRNHILKHFTNEWAHGKVYWTRLAFVDAAECAHYIFSARLFTSLFKEEVLGLKDDSVVNVKLRLLRFLRDMAGMWMKEDEFLQAVRQLSADADWQVSYEARDILEGLDRAKGPNAAMLQLDQEKEAAEDGFFVHTRQRKRKAKGPRGSQGSVVRSDEAQELTEMESIVSNEMSLLGGAGGIGDSEGLAGLRSGTSRGSLRMDKRASGRAGSGKDINSVGEGGAGIVRAESNNSALAEGSPTKGSRSRSRQFGAEGGGKVMDHSSTGVAGAMDGQSEKKGGLQQLLCGCFGGG